MKTLNFKSLFNLSFLFPLEQRDILSELWSLLWELATANNFTPWGWGYLIIEKSIEKKS